jgi:hypothetical protein
MDAGSFRGLADTRYCSVAAQLTLEGTELRMAGILSFRPLISRRNLPANREGGEHTNWPSRLTKT